MEIKGLSFEKPSWYGWRIESKCFGRCFYPHKNNNSLTKLITLVFVTGWVIITALMAVEDVSTVRPVYYGFYTAVVFLILGRIWGLEIDSLVEKL